MQIDKLKVVYPEQKRLLENDQDQEWFHLVTDDGLERIRVHDYDRVFDIPGLYEEVVHNRLRCDSPRVISRLLKETIEAAGESDTPPLRVLDFGAGNGIVGQWLKSTLDTETIVGVDIIDEARNAALRDRPEIYDDYYVADLSQPEVRQRPALERTRFNALVTVAALGFGDISTRAFVNAFNIVEIGSWVVFNIKDRFLGSSDDSGFGTMLQEMIGKSLKVHRKHHYCHRRSMSGAPLYYYAIVGRKESDF